MVRPAGKGCGDRTRGVRARTREVRRPHRGARMDLGLGGRVALVTGGARDVGREIAVMLAREGATVAINYLHSKTDAEATVAAIRGAGGTAQAYAADVADHAAVMAMVEAIIRDHGRLDVLVNNAG